MRKSIGSELMELLKREEEEGLVEGERKALIGYVKEKPGIVIKQFE